MTQRLTESLKVRVELIVSAQLAGHSVDDDTSRWIANIDQVMSDKLSAVGLIAKRETATLQSFIDEYYNAREKESRFAKGRVLFVTDLRTHPIIRDALAFQFTSVQSFSFFQSQFLLRGAGSVPGSCTKSSGCQGPNRPSPIPSNQIF